MNGWDDNDMWKEGEEVMSYNYDATGATLVPAD
jgi:hypothetical protein